MREIVGVKFKKLGKIYFFDPNGFELTKGQGVIVETARGLEFGEIAINNGKVKEERIVAPLKNVVRIATEEDAVMLITDKGTIIRINVKDVSILGRSTQGVTLMRTNDGGKVVSIETLTPDIENE